MKLLLSFTMAALLLSAASITANAQKADEEAIKKVVQQETSTFFHKNYDGWADTWAHDSADYILRAGTYGYSEMKGWNSISTQYKQNIQNMTAMDDAEIAPFLNKKDYRFYINGNVATVSFEEGDHNPSMEIRTLVKQNGNWKMLNMTVIDNASYAMQDVISNMKAMSGKWELEGKDTTEPSGGADVQMVQFDLKSTPDGMEQSSIFKYTNNGRQYAPPADIEYFIPDYRTMTVTYLDIQKNNAGLTATRTGKVTSEQPNSFTVTVMNPDKPSVKEVEYTVTLQNGKWHQVSKNYDDNGKVVRTSTINLHRM